MDAFFSRFEKVIRGLLHSDPNVDFRQNSDLYSEAWEELEEYLRTGESKIGSSDQHSSNRESAERGSPGYSPRPSSVAQDYRNLDLSPGTDFATVKKAYRRLMRVYHPDRYAGDPERQRIATEISVKLNASFNRIRITSGRT